MGLLDVNISKEDRPRIDRLTNVLERVVSLAEEVVRGRELTIRISLDAKRDDIQK